jgi:hypothetical protein
MPQLIGKMQRATTICTHCIKYPYKCLLIFMFGLGIGLAIDCGIGIHVNPIPHDFDTIAILEACLAFVIGTITLVGAVVVVMVWNNLEERVRKITDGLDKRIGGLEEKIKDTEERIEVANQFMLDFHKTYMENEYLC